MCDAVEEALDFVEYSAVHLDLGFLDADALLEVLETVGEDWDGAGVGTFAVGLVPSALVVLWWFLVKRGFVGTELVVKVEFELAFGVFRVPFVVDFGKVVRDGAIGLFCRGELVHEQGIGRDEDVLLCWTD